MFGGQGGGDPPPYPFQQPPGTAAGTSQQSAPAVLTGGMFGASDAQAGGAFNQMANPSGVFGQPGNLFGHTTTTTADWTAPGPPSASGSTLFGKPLDSSTAMPGQHPTPSTGVPAAATATFGSVAASTQASTSSTLFGQPDLSGPVFGQTSSTAAPTFGQVSAAAGTNFGQSVGSGPAGFQSATAVTSPVFGATTSAPPTLFGHPATSSAGTEPPGATRSGAAAGSAFTDKTGTTIRSLFGAGTADATGAAPAPSSALFGKSSGDKTGLFGKSNRATVDPEDYVAAVPPSSLSGPARGDAAPLPPPAEESEALPSDGRAPGAAGGAPRLRSVFARPGTDSPTARKRRTSITAAEASRRSLARTGLFGKPAETRPADKPPAVSGPTGPRVQRLNSAEELHQVTSLLCTEVPDGYNDRGILSRHFAKFGNVVKVSCNLAKNTAAVHFADHAAADAARKRGMKVHPKLQPMSLFFRRPVKGGAEPAAGRTHRRPPDDDVSDELRAMSGTSATREPEPRSRRAEPGPKSRRAEPEPKPRRAAAPAPAAAAASVSAAPAAAAVNVSELNAALRQPAVTASDRYRVLDARDKLHRAAMRREGPARSGPLVGTCPDMCPEKERYMREEKHQISNQYERDRERQGGFEMDHRLAVKLYSRSSADQEEPLQHELRTPAALLLTMDYLVTHVTDGETRDTGDWFHFIWDRTRGIRKDITQQQLTDVISVGLVEKCARFHVHCAAALCELSRDMFDQKINNENLTKCLQTLKHMYHDLSLKGVQCEREAEFRAYDILLNLNQGDILREVQTYSDEVRDSPEVHSALRLYLALSTNNYVRFFKLVRRSGYLTACLLQRYFNQVRTRALDVITRTFCPPKKVVEYPLSELRQILGFESEDECASVLRQHGLESEEGTAYLERALFQPPDTAPELRRCHALIDAKLDTSVGQVINGGALPADPLPSYRPHDSFDGQGVLRRSALNAQDQGSEPAGDTEPAAAPQRAASPAAAAGERAVQAVAGALLTEVVTEETRRQADQLLTVAAVVRQLCVHLYQATMDDVITEMVGSVCRSELMAAQQEQEQQRRHQEEQRRQQEEQAREADERRIRLLREQEHAKRDQELKDRLSAVLTETLVAEVCLDETADIAEQEMRSVQTKHSAVAELHRQLWTDGADRLARQTAEQVLIECRRQRQALVQALIQIGRRMTLRRLVGRWRQAAEDGRRLRAEQRWFPAGRPLHDAQTTLRLMGGPREPPHPQADAWTERSLCSLLLNEQLSSRSVSVAALLSRCSATADLSSGHLLWKLAVPAPAACPLTQWLLHKLSDDDDVGGQHDQTQQLPDGVLQRGSVSVPAGGRLSLCVRQLCGRPGEAVGSAGLLLAFSGPESAGRLLALLGELPREPLLPLAVLTAPGGQQEALTWLQLPGRLRHGAVTTYRVFEVEPDDALQSGETLASALQWLFEHRPAVPPLRAGPLRHLAQDFIGRQVTSRLYSDLHMRRNKKRVEQSAAACVALYNAAMRHLSTVLSSGSLPNISWPPGELIELAGTGSQRPETVLPPPSWNQPARLLRLQQTVAELSLPCLDVDPDWSWAECCAKVLQYVGRLTEDTAHGTPALYRVRSLLRDRLQLLRRAAWPLEDDVSDQPLSASLPWTDIIQCCIELRTSRLSSAEEVFYLPDELANFRVPDVWTECTSVAHTGECLTLNESVAIAKRSLDESVAISMRSLDESATISKRSLDAAAESPSVKRRLDKSSFAHPTLDVSIGISRELNVSLDWENRLRELVDAGNVSAAAAECAAVPAPGRATPPPPPAGRRASLDRQLQQLRVRLAADRRHAGQLSQLLVTAGAEPSGPDCSPGGRPSAAGAGSRLRNAESRAERW